MITVHVLIDERPDLDALHAALDKLGRNQVRWPRGADGDLVVEFPDGTDATPEEIRGVVRSVLPTPEEAPEAKRRRLVVDGLSKADLVAALLDPSALADLRARLA